MSDPQVRVGQVWRRRSDGKEVTVETIPTQRFGLQYMTFRSTRVCWIEYPNFLRKYEFVKESPDVR